MKNIKYIKYSHKDVALHLWQHISRTGGPIFNLQKKSYSKEKLLAIELNGPGLAPIVITFTEDGTFYSTLEGWDADSYWYQGP